MGLEINTVSALFCCLPVFWMHTLRVLSSILAYCSICHPVFCTLWVMSYNSASVLYFYVPVFCTPWVQSSILAQRCSVVFQCFACTHCGSWVQSWPIVPSVIQCFAHYGSWVIILPQYCALCSSVLHTMGPEFNSGWALFFCLPVFCMHTLRVLSSILAYCSICHLVFYTLWVMSYNPASVLYFIFQ